MFVKGLIAEIWSLLQSFNPGAFSKSKIQLLKHFRYIPSATPRLSASAFSAYNAFWNVLLLERQLLSNRSVCKRFGEICFFTPIMDQELLPESCSFLRFFATWHPVFDRFDYTKDLHFIAYRLKTKGFLIIKSFLTKN